MTIQRYSQEKTKQDVILNISLPELIICVYNYFINMCILLWMKSIALN